MVYKIVEWDKVWHGLAGVALTIAALSLRPDIWLSFWAVFALACFWEVLFRNKEQREAVMDIMAVMLGWMLIIISLTLVYYYTIIGGIYRLLPASVIPLLGL